MHVYSRFLETVAAGTFCLGEKSIGSLCFFFAFAYLYDHFLQVVYIMFRNINQVTIVFSTECCGVWLLFVV